MVTKKVRTEYMKRFRDPKWETFSKCYEDSLKYRLTRRVMEHSHKPWFWDGWDSGSESSGWSTPRLTRGKVAPLSLPPPTSSVVKQRLSRPGPRPRPEDGDTEVEAGEAAAVTENGAKEASGGSAVAALTSSGDTATDDGPADTASSDGEPVDPAPGRRHRRRTTRPESGHRDGDKPAVGPKLPRAKSQPPISTKEKENRRASSRLDWAERRTEVRGTTSDSNASNAGAQTRREADKPNSSLDRRRSRSADLEKMRRSRLTVVDDRWMTEYMRCFSARLR